MWPATQARLLDAGYRPADRSTCRRCGAAILWTITPNGKRMPLESLEAEIDGEPDSSLLLWQPHFGTCKRRMAERPATPEPAPDVGGACCRCGAGGPHGWLTHVGKGAFAPICDACR